MAAAPFGVSGLAKLMLAGFLLFSGVGLVLFTFLDWLILRRMFEVSPPQALPWAVFLLCLLPLTLACWAVPLSVAFRLRYDQRVPAGLPSWEKDGRVGLIAHYRSAFWRGYASLFAWSLLLLPVYLFVTSWWLVAAHLLILVWVALRAAVRQARLNARDHLVIDRQRRTLTVAPLGELPCEAGVEDELVVTPKKDQTFFWVTLAGQRWTRWELREHAQAIADWIKTSGVTPLRSDL